MKEQIINDIDNNPIILYMKGTKEIPMCGLKYPSPFICGKWGRGVSRKSVSRKADFDGL